MLEKPLCRQLGITLPVIFLLPLLSKKVSCFPPPPPPLLLDRISIRSIPSSPHVSTPQEYLQMRLQTPCQSFFPIRQPVQVGGLDDHKGRQRRLRLCQARKQHSLGLCIRILAVGLKLTNSCRLKYILYSAVFFNRY